MTSRLSQFLDRLRGYSDLECLVREGHSYSYSQLLLEFERWDRRFDEYGVTAGAVVGLRADYSLEAIAALLALFSRRATVALIPRDGDVAEYLEDSRATAYLGLADGTEPVWQPCDAGPEHPLLGRLHRDGDSGLVIFTSGSTGRPKAALHSVERFFHKFSKPGRRFRTLAFLLFDHIAGMDTLFYTLSNGGVIVVTRDRSPGAICELIAAARVEVLPASPSFLRLMCLAGDADGADLSSLKVITYGSEPMDTSTLVWLNTRFLNLEIIQKYGTTEVGSPRSVSRGSDSLWLKLDGPGVETRVVDGLLYLRSEGTMLGYLNAPSPLDAEGWYCTGDLVEVETDRDGEWIRFRGRASSTINVGGEKVAPAEVEDVILELPFVRDAVVTGERNPLMGQVVAARVGLAAAIDAREAQKRIRLHCRSRLAGYKVPVDVTIVDDRLTTERQKLKRVVE